MSDIKHLAQLVRELEDQLQICMRCGMCQSVCPLFAETGLEFDVARGKLALLDGLRQEIFKNPKGVYERLARCLLCGACAANCPSGVKVLDIFIKARAILGTYLGLSLPKRAILRGMLAHPGFFDRIMKWGTVFQGIFIKPADDMLGTYCGRTVSPLSDRHIKALAPLPFHETVPKLNNQKGASGIKVAFFPGCLIDKVFPEIGEAVLKSLDHHGIGVFIPEGFGCCGIPAMSAGDAKTFNSLVSHNLSKFTLEPFDYLVTACASCTTTIKKVWPMMASELNSSETEQLHALADKTMDVAQFLTEIVGVHTPYAQGDPGKKVSVTYHDPCHLKLSLGVAEQPRTLIRTNQRYQLKEMAEADRCCGCGGSFSLQHHKLSASIGRRKRSAIVESQCSVVATGCPACMLQISDMLSQAGDQISVKHVIEIYAESLP
ncbi:MAG: (Fe-S)-binding protein [Syntrophobacteraceae bacterium]